MSRHRTSFLVIFSMWLGMLSHSLLHAAPTEQREWTSSAGTKIKGSVTGVSDNVVMLETADKGLQVPLDKFSDADQTYLRKHFGISAPGAVPAAAAFEPDTSITLPKGKGQGPVQAGPGSSYFYYIPQSLPKGRKHPLMVILNPGHGNLATLPRYIPGAERNGWILITSVESANGVPREVSNPAITKAIEHAKSTLPIDPKRVFIGGFSGGSSHSFSIATEIKAAGVLGCGMGGRFTGIKIDKEVPLYILSGSNCWNRDDPGTTIAAFCPKSKDSLARYFTGNHDWANAELLEDGMTHLHEVVLAKRRIEYAAEASANEAAILRWAEELKTTNPARALMWTTFLMERPANAKLLPAVTTLHRELKQNHAASRWNEGLKAIHNFAVEEVGKKDMKAMAKGWAESQKELQKLAADFADTPWKETLDRMLQPAQKSR